MKKCPNCDVIMNEVIKVDILIDVCPKCMGIWLDKGELDKIIYKTNAVTNNHEYDDDRNEHNDHHHDNRDYKHSKYKGKRGLGNILGNLFD